MAGSFVVPTKIRSPVLNVDTVDRTQLDERLTQALAQPAGVAVVCAPAGWGKTTTVCSWASRVELPVAWLTLDGADNDPARFCAHLDAAAAGASGLETMAVGAPSGSDGMLRAAETLVAALDGTPGLCLVLDDYHAVVSPAIHDGVDALLRWLPPSSHVVIASRVDPPLANLSRLRMNGQLAEIRAADLAFSFEEARSLLASTMTIDPKDESVVELLERTEGWVAGLCLAGLSMNHHEDSDAFVRHFAGDDRLVADYFRSELIENQPDDIRAFLLGTSILDELSGPLCDAILETTDSTARLRDLERSHRLLVPLDDSGNWWRYHHLLTEWLRAELALDPGWMMVLHSRAASWHLSHGSPESALHHAFAAGDLELAARTVEEHWRAALAVGRHVTVLAWFDRLGDDAVAANASLCLARAQLALNMGEPDDAPRWMRRAEQVADPHDEVFIGQMHRNLGIQRRMSGDLVAAEEHCRRSAQLLTDPDSRFELDVLLGAVLVLAGEVSEAIDILAPLPTGGNQREDQLSVQLGLAYRAIAEYEVGQRRAARATADTALEVARATRLEDSPTLIGARLVLGCLALDDGALDIATDHLRWALASARQARATTSIYLTLVANGRLASHERRSAEARRLFKEARDVLATMPTPRGLAHHVDIAEHHVRINHHRPAETADDLALVEDLTNREHSVLRLLPSELTMREIGGELFVSHNTVKGHVKTIYRKLGVTSRESCVARARRLGLL